MRPFLCFNALSFGISAVGQLDGIAVRVLGIAKTKYLTLQYLTKTSAPLHQRFPQDGNILGVKDKLRPLAARR